MVEIVETEVDIVTDGKGHVTEIIETEVDEVVGADGEVVGVVESRSTSCSTTMARWPSVTETEVVQLDDDEEKGTNREGSPQRPHPARSCRRSRTP